MKKIVFNTFKYLVFLAIGVLIFWFLYRKIEWVEVKNALKGLKYIYIIISVLLGLLSQLSRAIRWKMLIKPLGYNPGTGNTFLSILVLYFVNLIIPRAGEVARCTVLSRTDKIPFTKLVGTVFIERLADVIMLFFLAIVIFATNISIVSRFFEENPNIKEQLGSLFTARNFVYLVLAGVVFIFLLYLLYKILKKSRIKEKLIELKNHFMEGIKSILHMKKKWAFIGHTFFIFLMWLIMLYVVFLAYEPTAHLSIRVGMVAFLMGGLGMLLPVQGGIGPWHFMVVETLILYGIPEKQGLIFAAVAHTSTNLVYILWGGIALLLLVIIYGNKTIRFKANSDNSD